MLYMYIDMHIEMVDMYICVCIYIYHMHAYVFHIYVPVGDFNLIAKYNEYDIL